ncbi:hypothetical protein SAMN05444695_102263 [Rhodococcus triatomae]|uniref:DUF2510 domain-containing protein n=1 Tax=Rhodococcus triatomae TaxID=300028 RepID=A0A1G8DBY9_9NOCA|nr:hypothetical protein SAMN05444695_102263 [Rhodococcus triatomae]
MNNDEHTGAEAGRYPRPDGRRRRYWDGSRWLELPDPDDSAGTYTYGFGAP